MRSQGPAFPSVLSSWLLPWDAALAQDRPPFYDPVGRLLSWAFRQVYLLTQRPTRRPQLSPWRPCVCCLSLPPLFG